jgi:16S rRNA processing protein RimM
LPHLAENGKDGYYWSDLIGTSVFNLQNEEFGNVIGLLRTGANDVLQVQSVRGDQKERLIPFIDQVIVDVDLEARKITVDWGLDY